MKLRWNVGTCQSLETKPYSRSNEADANYMWGNNLNLCTRCISCRPHMYRIFMAHVNTVYTILKWCPESLSKV